MLNRLFTFTCTLMLVSLPVQADSLFELTKPLTDEAGKSILISDFKGKPLVLTLTYTSCKAACPVTIRTLKEMSQDLAKQKIDANFAIISFDPKVDTPKKLFKFKRQWKLPDETWHFLSANDSTLEQIEKALDFKVVYDKVEDHYDHDRKIYIFDKSGNLKKVFEDWDSDFTNALSEENLSSPNPKDKS